jgi:hypothetical protein
VIAQILLGVAAIVGVLAVIVATRPSAFRIERSTSIAAAPAVPFAYVNDFHRWVEWSPYEKLDPAMKKTYEGAESGKGACYAWEGNDKAGAGRMTIESSDEPGLIVIKLEFTKPFAATNTGTFSFTPQSGGTKVVWAMEGKYDFAGKAAGLFMDLDKLVGSDFERGLASLKALSEKTA